MADKRKIQKGKKQNRYLFSKWLMPKSIFASMLVGLIAAGLFSATFYAFGAALYNPGDTNNPNCSPTDPTCTVAPAATYNFGSNNFGGAASDTGSFTTYGNYVTYGSVHNRGASSSYYFGPEDDASISYNSDLGNFIIDPGSTSNVLNLGDGSSQDIYKLKFYTASNPGIISYNDGNSTFSFGTNTISANSLTLTGTALTTDNGGTGISTSPTTGQLLVGQSNGTYALTTLSPSSGVYTDANGVLTSTAPTSGTAGYWSRSGSILSPVTSGDYLSYSISNAGVSAIKATNTLGRSGYFLSGSLSAPDYSESIIADNNIGGSLFSKYTASYIAKTTTGIANENYGLDSYVDFGQLGPISAGYFHSSGSNIVQLVTSANAIDATGGLKFNSSSGNNVTFDGSSGIVKLNGGAYLDSTSALQVYGKAIFTQNTLGATAPFSYLASSNYGIDAETGTGGTSAGHFVGRNGTAQTIDIGLYDGSSYYAIAATGSIQFSSLKNGILGVNSSGLLSVSTGTAGYVLTATGSAPYYVWQASAAGFSAGATVNDGTNTLSFADNTYAINAAGENLFSGINSASGYSVIFNHYTGPGDTYVAKFDSQSSAGSVILGDVSNTYAINATGSNLFTSLLLDNVSAPESTIKNNIISTQDVFPGDPPVNTAYGIFATASSETSSNRSSAVAGQFNSGDYWASLGDSADGFAGYFTDGTSIGDSVYLANGTNAIDVTGNVNVSNGQLIVGGKVEFNADGTPGDPPYVYFNMQTEDGLKAMLSKNFSDPNAQPGAVMFYNQDSGQMEIYMTAEDQFYTLGSLALNSSGSAGTGTVSGVSNSNIGSISSSSLLALGMTLANGVAQLSKIIVDTATINTANIQTANIQTIQMTDSATGSKYCIWIENGNWQKVVGNCLDVAPASLTGVAQNPAPSIDTILPPITNTTTSTDQSSIDQTTTPTDQSSDLPPITNTTTSTDQSSIDQTTTPTDQSSDVTTTTTPTGGDVLQNAGAALLNAVWRALKGTVGASLSGLSRVPFINSLEFNIQNDIELLDAGLIRPLVDLFSK